MNLGINGRVALVLGAGGGLGGAIADALAAEGARLAIADINEEALAGADQRLQTAGANTVALHWDISESEALAQNAARIENELGPVSILVNNTGGPPPTPAAGADIDLWHRHFNAMVASVIAITDRFLPGMREAGYGRVVTSTSSGVVAPIPNLAISNALRLALVGWSKTLSREVAPDGVTVNIVLPGRIATDRIRFLDEQKAAREGRTVEEVAAESTASIPMARYGTPEEYGGMVAFLASVQASYITGSIIRVDGGLIPSI